MYTLYAYNICREKLGNIYIKSTSFSSNICCFQNHIEPMTANFKCTFESRNTNTTLSTVETCIGKKLKVRDHLVHSPHDKY